MPIDLHSSEHLEWPDIAARIFNALADTKQGDMHFSQRLWVTENMLDTMNRCFDMLDADPQVHRKDWEQQRVGEDSMRSR